MKTEAKLTSKGQITVPKRVREALGVRAGDKIVFEQNGDNILVRTVRPKGVFEQYRGTVDFGIGRGRKAIIKAIRDLRDPD
jgi:AbrB family looped-hinge helix DNA binding protein